MIDPATENAVARVRKALVARRDALAREQTAHAALVAAKDVSLAAETEVAEAQNALRARLLATPEVESPAAPVATPPEPPAKKTPKK